MACYLIVIATLELITSRRVTKYKIKGT